MKLSNDNHECLYSNQTCLLRSEHFYTLVHDKSTNCANAEAKAEEAALNQHMILTSSNEWPNLVIVEKTSFTSSLVISFNPDLLVLKWRSQSFFWNSCLCFFIATKQEFHQQPSSNWFNIHKTNFYFNRFLCRLAVCSKNKLIQNYPIIVFYAH